MRVFRKTEARCCTECGLHPDSGSRSMAHVGPRTSCAECRDAGEAMHTAACGLGRGSESNNQGKSRQDLVRHSPTRRSVRASIQALESKELCDRTSMGSAANV